MNPTPVNSSNIANFGFGARFKLADKQIFFYLDGFTTFVGDGAENVAGVYFKVIDPTGILLKDFDFDNPDIPAGQNNFTLDVPSGLFMFGWWQISGVIQDEDGKRTQIDIKKNICEPAGIQGGQITGILKADVNCNAPSIKINENTNLIYNGLKPALLTKEGNFYYPQGTLDPIAFVSTPILISGTNQVYTGDYKVDLTTMPIYELGDGISVEIKYFTTLKFTVNCNSGMASIICCITAVQDIYEKWPNTERGRVAKSQLDQIAPYVYIALAHEKLGMSSDEQIQKIADILGCDCKCGAQLVEPRPVDATQNVVIAPGCGINVEEVTDGDTTTFTMSGQTAAVQKGDDDPAFNIVTSQEGCATLYLLTFNYPELAEQLLITIKEDDNLASLLNSIIDTTLFAEELVGFDGKCIIDLTKVDFSLAIGISQTGVQTVNSIVIDAVTFTAPGGLALVNNTGIATWLNSLGKGTFTVVKDLTAQTVTIGSLQNTHKVATFTLTNVVAGNSSVKVYLFSSTTKSIPDLLQAIYDYVCALDTSNILFGVDALQQYSFSNDFSTINKVTISRTDKLNVVLTNLIKAQQQLFTRLAAVGLTCTNVKGLFTTVDKTLVPTDGVFGLKGGSCALVPWSEVASIILSQVTGSTTLQSMLCALTQGCQGAVCAPPTNVSAVFASGTLTVNANDVGISSTPVQIRYRVNNSGLSFTQFNGTAADLPKSITSLPSAQYEVQMRIQCSNGVFSPWIATVTNNGCAVPTAFAVNVDGANFSVSGTLSGSQTIIEVLMTDPNGGQTTTINDFGAVSGTFTIPIPGALTGDYTFQARAVCDNTSSPRFVSPFLSPYPVTVGSSGPVPNLYAWAGYGLSLSITAGTATGIPTDWDTPPITTSKSAYVPTIGAGTILVTPAGTLGPPSAHLKLVKNNTTVLDSHAISGLSTITLTLPANVNAPDVLSIEIDTP